MKKFGTIVLVAFAALANFARAGALDDARLLYRAVDAAEKYLGVK